MSWLETKYLYAGLLLFSLAYPLAQSFEKRLQYYKQWKGLFLGILLMMIIFIPWDIWFTKSQYWGFNANYFMGYTWFHLPIEEWLFFVIIPFACFFIFEVLAHFFPILKDFHIPKVVTISLGLIFIGISFIFRQQMYSFMVFSISGLILLYSSFYKTPLFSLFISTYLISFIPFFLINGILTGSLIQSPVVWYSDQVIFNIRLLSIPIEDSLYNFIMLYIVYKIYILSRNKTS